MWRFLSAKKKVSWMILLRGYSRLFVTGFVILSSVDNSLFGQSSLHPDQTNSNFIPQMKVLQEVLPFSIN